MEGRRKVDGFRGVYEEVVNGRRVFVPVLKVFGEQLDLGSHPTAQDAAMVGAHSAAALAAVPVVPAVCCGRTSLYAGTVHTPAEAVALAWLAHRPTTSASCTRRCSTAGTRTSWRKRSN